jgi:hypothetical protein
MRVDWIACDACALPTIRSERPGVFCTPKCWCSVGRRRSASTASTFAPLWASAAARFATVVVLPSPGFALVITTARPVVSADVKIRFVRSTR